MLKTLAATWCCPTSPLARPHLVLWTRNLTITDIKLATELRTLSDKAPASATTWHAASPCTDALRIESPDGQDPEECRASANTDAGA